MDAMVVKSVREQWRKSYLPEIVKKLEDVQQFVKTFQEEAGALGLGFVFIATSVDMEKTVKSKDLIITPDVICACASGLSKDVMLRELKKAFKE